MILYVLLHVPLHVTLHATLHVSLQASEDSTNGVLLRCLASNLMMVGSVLLEKDQQVRIGGAVCHYSLPSLVQKDQQVGMEGAA